MAVQKLFVGLVACAALAFAVPTPHDLAVRDIGDCPGYEASNVVKSDSSLTADLKLAGSACNVYGDDLTDLKLLVEYQAKDRLHVKIYDADEQVYQVQEQVVPRPKNDESPAADADLEFALVESPFSFTVTRKENGEVLFDTSAEQLIFETQYVRLRTSLPQNPNIYGLGEHSDPFRLPTVKYHRTFWNAESPFIPHGDNLYGSHPVYFDHRGDKGTHGVFLLNSNGMDVVLDQTDSGDQYLEYNTIGGVLDFYFLAGKQPADVSRQYADTVGYSAMFPYWTLGFHQCKYGYWDVNFVAEVVANYSTAGIPLEVMWTDIDYMDGRQDFTTDPQRFDIGKMRELVSTLHSRGQRYVLILDPGVHAKEGYAPYEKGHEMSVFHKNADGSDYFGIQWAGTVAWPDWLAPNTSKWWADEIATTFSADEGIDLDGIWVDMNEASNFCGNTDCNALDPGNNPPPVEHEPRPNTGRPIPGFPADFQPTPPKSKQRRGTSLSVRQSSDDKFKGLPDRDLFQPKYRIHNHGNNDLSTATIWTNNTHADGTVHYDTHNLHGHMMSHVTYDAMLARRPGLRPMVLTRSTFAGNGRKSTHWFGDNASTWEDYRTSIRQMLAFVSMHQMPMVGSDVCGFNKDTDEYLCARWALLGAFQPFYRNHAEISAIQQEFYQWPLVTDAAKKAIDTRYKLMDYIYTALYYQTTEGTPMINPLFFFYPEDTNTFNIQHQWFYGDALLISPVTTDYSDSVTYYLPKDIFYDYWTGERVEGKGANVTINDVAYTDIPVHVRAGSIIPQRTNSANTTAELRKQDFEVLVAPDADGKAQGRLYIDEGEKIEQPEITELTFKYENGQLTTTGRAEYKGASGESVRVTKIKVLGLDSDLVQGEQTKLDPVSGVAEVEGSWSLNGAFSVRI
ncbi:hypothetical protein N0V90_007485 [Kalmusia sp. IMI 367209]|nr:hypothetical protein N0V90_007485 [Kalmusia sp. IMI 367209]